ncbi:MAG TPA: DMT family transporter [Steroidobacteraceae bacterium]|nr:DMT family transporter [Steroidobacteraceae bacterium]
MSAAVLLGLIAAVGYGISDYLWKHAGHAVGLWRSIFYGNLFGLVLLTTLALLTHEPAAHGSAPAVAWLWAVGAAFILLAGAVTFTQAMIKGTLAVVSPVAASYGAVAALLSLATGEHLQGRSWAGISVTVCGVCLVSAPANAGAELRQHLRSSGAVWALGAACCYGSGFWLQGRLAVPALGPLLPVWTCYAIITVAVGFVARRQVLAPIAPVAVRTIVLSSALFVLGYLALTWGFATGHIAVVVVLSTLGSAVTVLLARVLDRAHIATHQWLALGVIILGLVLIRS